MLLRMHREHVERLLAVGSLRASDSRPGRARSRRGDATRAHPRRSGPCRCRAPVATSCFGVGVRVGGLVGARQQQRERAAAARRAVDARSRRRSAARTRRPSTGRGRCPRPFGLVVKNGSKMRPWTSSGMPMPLSRTRNSTNRPGVISSACASFGVTSRFDGLNREASAFRHRVARIEREVDDHLLELRGIGAHRPQVRARGADRSRCARRSGGRASGSCPSRAG